MSAESSPREASTLAAIFQKAYARAVALQRLDEQLQVLLEQRQRLEADFREAQTEVNEECDRMLKLSSIAPRGCSRNWPRRASARRRSPSPAAMAA